MKRLALVPVRRFLAGLLCLLALCLVGAQPSVMLGINYPLTGPYSVEGLDQIRAARLAVDEINRHGGIMGRRVVLSTRDSASDVLRTRLNIKQLIEEGCSMIFGGSSSAVAIASADICQKYQVPFFGTLTYSTATTLEAAHRVAFRECNDSRMSAMVMADWLNEHFGGRRFFYITADYTWGWTTEESFRQVTGTLDAGAHPRVLTPLGGTDYAAALEQARAFKPDVLVMVLFGKDMAYALRQADEMELRGHCQIVVPNLTLGMAERAGARAMEGVMGTLPWNWKIPYQYGYQRGIDFVESFEQRYGRYPSTSGASAYTIVHEYKSAVERAGSLRSPAVIRALEGHTYQLLKDSQTWRALDHQSVQTVYMVRGNSLGKVLADPLRLDFLEVLDSRPGPETVLPEDQWKRLRQAAGLPPELEPLPE